MTVAIIEAKRGRSRPRAIPDTPPAPSAKVVRQHRKTLEIERDALRAGAVDLALASARGDMNARNKLAALYWKIMAIEFEINLNQAAAELATQEDAAAEVAWRAAIQTMDPEEIIAGIGKESCCRRCSPGESCVITASAPYAGAVCGHPLTQRHLFHVDDEGRKLFPYREYPRALEIYQAACRKLKVQT